MGRISGLQESQSLLNIGMQAMREIMEEEGGSLTPQKTQYPAPDEDVYVPDKATYLGTALSDQKPVLLDLYNPSPGPILVVGDYSTGKTDFLQKKF